MQRDIVRFAGLALVLSLVSISGCARIQSWIGGAEPAPPAPTSGERATGRDATRTIPTGSTDRDAERDDGTVSEAAKRAERAAVPASPAVAAPSAAAAADVRRRALRARGLRIVISTEHRALWLMRDSAVLFSAPVAVGMQQGFTYAGRSYVFLTPIGRRSVLAKARDPIWTPPDWHYFEFVVKRSLEPVQLRQGSKIPLEDSTRIEVRGDQVGRVNRFGNFAPFTPGTEIIFDGKVFIPPFGSAQRNIPEILGTRKFELGDGYLIHGTNEENSIGDAVSHGCVRMYNEDVEWLYERVPVGTAVWVY